jgi:hypothetical protein
MTMKVTSGHQCKGSEETGTTLMFGHWEHQFDVGLSLPSSSSVAAVFPRHKRFLSLETVQRADSRYCTVRRSRKANTY